MDTKPKIIVICGPTASGKSSLAVEIANLFDGEIISADSRQVYKGLDIGTAKITQKEMSGIPHHLLDVENPQNTFSVEQYKTLGEAAIADILSRKKIPITCGGTGYYISALVEGILPAPVPPNEALRIALEEKPEEELFALIQEKDPMRAETIDPNNKRRLIRALEIIDSLGSVPVQVPNPQYNTIWIGLEFPKEEHQIIIRERTISRLEQGMIKEAERLHSEGLSYERMDDLGLEYRLLAQYLQGILTKEELAEKINTETWQYVRRQYTWFRRNKNIKWFTPEEKSKIQEAVRTFLF